MCSLDWVRSLSSVLTTALLCFSPQSGINSPVPTSQSKYLQLPAAGRKNSTAADRKKSNDDGAGKHFSSSTKAEDPKSPATDQLQKRRRSTFKGIASSLMSVRRMTKGSMDKDMAAVAAAAAAAARPKVRLENTYRMSPSEKQHFSSCKAETLIHEVLESQLSGQTYSASKAPALVAGLSERVKAAVKGLHCERHKLIANVVVGPVKEQGMVVASRCLWDSSTDISSTASYNNGKIFAIATVFAVYYE